MKVKDIERIKNFEVISVKGELPVAEAVAKMVKRNIGALIVMDEDGPAGMFTERDVLRCWGEKEQVQDLPVRDIMSKGLRVVRMDAKVSEAMAVMTKKGIRHLPVVDGDEHIVGVLSMRDVVTAQVGELNEEVSFLKNFIISSS